MDAIGRIATAAGLSAVAGGAYWAFGLTPPQASLSAGLAFVGTSFALLVPLPAIGSGAPRPQPVAGPATKGLQELVAEGQETVARLKRSARRITNDEAAAPVLRIADAAGEGLSALSARGTLDPLARQVLAYYLPETVKLVEALHALEAMRAPDVETGRTVVATLKRLESVFYEFADASANADVSQLQRDLRLLEGTLDRLQGAKPA